MLYITRQLLVVLIGAMLATAAYADDDDDQDHDGRDRDASVAGRTYCVVTNTLTNFPAPAGVFELRSSVARRMTTFNYDGTFSQVVLSSKSNTYNADGTVDAEIGAASDGIGSFVQTGSRLDLVLSSTLLATWYVSKDGSTLHGTRIRSFVAGNGQTVGQTITWTAVEGRECIGEL